MIDYERLARAAFDNDAQSAEIPLTVIVHRLGSDIVDVAKVGEQRALKAIISQRGPEERDRMRDQAYAGKWTVEDLDEDESNLVRLLTAAWTDGVLTALRIAKEETHG